MQSYTVLIRAAENWISHALGMAIFLALLNIICRPVKWAIVLSTLCHEIEGYEALWHLMQSAYKFPIPKAQITR